MVKREKIILVTGSTGFLGGAVTRRLLISGYRLRLLIRKKNSNISSNRYQREDTIKEHVLGSQQKRHLPEGHGISDDMTGEDESLKDMYLNNVEILEGDITSIDLGLDKEGYRRLCCEVDEVFHCAAATHFERQQVCELTAVNVKGTERMLQFAASGRQKRFHYISTAYVAGKQNDIAYENVHPCEPLFNNEYERSKFIAEQIVIMHAESSGIPYTIYRPGIIVGDSGTGDTCRFDGLYVFAKALFNIKKSCVKYGNEDTKDIEVRIPGLPEALINLVPVDYVADAIVAILKEEEAINKVYHITNPDPPELTELRDLLLSVLEIGGINVSIDGEMGHKRLSKMEKLFLRLTRAYYPYLFSRLRFDCRNTQGALEDTDIICPAMTEGLLRVLVDYAVSRRWGEGKSEELQEVEMS